MDTYSLSCDPQTKSSLSNKPPKKRGKINIVACDRCKRDKKKCDGYFLTQKACKYCRNHNEDCVYSEPNLLRICRILNAAAKNAAAEEREDNDSEKPVQELQKQIVKHEDTIIKLVNQLENKNKIEQSYEFIGKLYLFLFSDPQTSNEQTIILKKLCEITNNLNPNIDNENINKIRDKLLILVSNDRTDAEKKNSWDELDKFVKMHNDNIIIPLDNFSTSNISGFSYPSGSTTPIPSPQQDVQFKKHNSYEPYPSGGRISIRPSKTNVMVWHQNDPCEDVPVIAVNGSQNDSNRSINIINSNETETFQNSNIQFDNISSNENLQFSAPNVLSSSNEIYGFDEVGQFFSNVTSPTFSNNSISDDNLEFPTFISQPLVEDWLGIFH